MTRRHFFSLEPCLCQASVTAIVLASFLSLLSFPASLSQAQTRAITSSGLNTTITQNGSVYQITGGTRPGNGPNLFHSFGEFSVSALDTARFLNTTPELLTSNILGRVTGGNPSSIFGTIDTVTYPGAHLFLMNPAGIVFGPNAQLNVGGSANFTTADYLRLTDNVQFTAIPGPQDALLSAAPVAAFGFLGPNAVAITVQGTQLAVPTDQTLSLVGGDITIQAAILEDGSVQPSRLGASSGLISLSSVASAGELLLPDLQPAPNANGESFSNFGSIALSQSTILDVSGDGAGTIRIRSGQFVMDDAFVLANTVAEGDGAETAIAIQAQSDLVLRNGSSISAAAFSGGSVGDIELNAQNIVLTEGSSVGAFGFGSASSGNITVTASEGILLTGMNVFGFGSTIANESSGFCDCSGTSGNLTLTAQLVTLEEQGQIRSLAIGDRRAGDVTLNVQDLTARSGGAVQSIGGDTASSGTVRITAEGSILLSGQFDSDNPSRIANINEGSGGTGAIILEAGRSLSLEDGARIRSETFSSLESGQDPKITIEADDSISLTGNSNIRVLSVSNDVGGLSLSANTISFADRSVVTTETFGDGNAGAISISGQDLLLSEGSLLNSSTFAAIGNGGDLTITLTGKLSLKGKSIDEFGQTTPTAISTITTGPGQGGQVSVSANSVEILDMARIDSSSAVFATGSAGNVTLKGLASPAESVVIDGAGSGIFTTTGGIGAGGNIGITSNTVTLQNGGTLSAATSGTGDAGSITANVGILNLTGNSSISSSSTGTATGAAGSVTIQGLASPADSVTVTNSSLLTSAANTGRGGSIMVEATNVTLDNATISASVRDFNATDPADSAASGLGNVGLTSSTMNMTGGTLSAATTGSRNAGTIRVTTTGNTLTMAGGARIESTTSSSGNAGMVTINSPSANLNDGTITTSTSGSGDAGSVTLTTTGNTVTLAGGSRISSSSTGTMANAGDAGSVTINAGNLFQSSGSTVATSAAQGQGGDITITASQEATLNNGTSITASSTGQGDAGNIAINAGGQFLMQNSSVTTQAAQASGGNISIAASNMVRMTNSQISASVFGGPSTAGGNITIDPTFVVLQNGQILAQAVQGQGGNILITALVPPILDASSLIDASSQFGLNGTVTIQSPTSNLSSVWARLQQNYVDVAALVRARCAAQVSGEYSSFVQTGRDAVPLEPGGWLLSPIALEGMAVTPPVAQEIPAPALTLSGVTLWGFDQDLSWPGLGKMPHRFASILDSACGS